MPQSTARRQSLSDIGSARPRRSAIFGKFAAHVLIGPTPGPSTIVDYKSCARMYLLPQLGDRLLAELDAQAIMDMKTQLLTQGGAKASVDGGSGKPLSPRTVAKILTLLGTVFLRLHLCSVSG